MPPLIHSQNTRNIVVIFPAIIYSLKSVAKMKPLHTFHHNWMCLIAGMVMHIYLYLAFVWWMQDDNIQKTVWNSGLFQK